MPFDAKHPDLHQYGGRKFTNELLNNTVGNIEIQTEKFDEYFKLQGIDTKILYKQVTHENAVVISSFGNNISKQILDQQHCVKNNIEAQGLPPGRNLKMVKEHVSILPTHEVV